MPKVSTQGVGNLTPTNQLHLRSLGIRTAYFSRAWERFTIKLLDHASKWRLFWIENLPENYKANSLLIRH